MRFANNLIIAAALALSVTPASGKMPAEEVAKLGNELTPMGAVRAANADGMIPEWTGAVKGLPTGLEWAGPGTPYPDPYADEKPLLTITAANVDEHRDRLSPGQLAMFETYSDTFRMPVYRSHREFAYSDAYYAKVRYNAEHAELYNNDEGIRGYVGAATFPQPKTGAEAVWLTRTTGAYASREGEYSDIAVFPNGTRSVRKSWFLQESPYADLTLALEPANEYPNLGGFGGYIMTNVTEPARDKGLITSIFEPYDYAENAREVWRYLPGSRRVRRAPTVGFDTPDGPGGLKTVDEVRGFNGSMERFEWKLIGLQEMYIPYHNYQFDDPSLDYDELLTRFHVNPDYMRYELKRVWVAEATLRPGERHIYGKRRIYVDEDTGLTAITENYDGRSELWKVVLFNNIYEYGGSAYIRRAQMYHDLRAGAYVADRMINDTAPLLYDQKPPRGAKYFGPTNVRKLGRR
ncbi:DUF1329 domain-containing protein [Halioglobus maricola]|uniref:DUF1329 domain-containing protein n=1 Tax=Halioglobus maricola TaxID=2601894 RepID=A0A5P9NQZ4_9GAMM|nr:DUF1329 domain-containing protein [Halioglobus maricola]QFU77348.1 DUF1329 domain-containing protein [Halioglobus maricola]